MSAADYLLDDYTGYDPTSEMYSFNDQAVNDVLNLNLDEWAEPDFSDSFYSPLWWQNEIDYSALPEEEPGILDILAGLINGPLATIGDAALSGVNTYQNYQSNELLQEALDLQNMMTQQAKKVSDQNQYRNFTGDAGRYTTDAYNVALNNRKFDLMTELMRNDDNIDSGFKDSFMQRMAGLSNQYEPIYQGYTNDMINKRNMDYGYAFNTQAPFSAYSPSPLAQIQQAAQNNSIRPTVTAPEDIDPRWAAMYRDSSNPAPIQNTAPTQILPTTSVQTPSYNTPSGSFDRWAYLKDN